MRLIFVRHGEPDYQKDCLTENGVIQAQSTAKRLQDEKITAVYSSPMGRAAETASFTAKAHSLTVQKLDFMHEIDWGDTETGKEAGAGIPYEGHPWTLACKLYSEQPESIGNGAWKEHPYFRSNRCMKYFRTIGEGLDTLLAGYGLIRNGSLYECRRESDETIALFAHGGSGGILFSYLLNLPFPFVLATMPYGVCSVSIIAFTDPVEGKVIPRLELFNDMRHLPSFRQEKLHFEK